MLLYNSADHYVRLNWRCLILDIQHRNVYIYVKLMLSVQCSYRPLNPLYSITHIKFTMPMRRSRECKCERQGSWKLEFLRLSKICLRPRPLPSENGNIPLMPPLPLCPWKNVLIQKLCRESSFLRHTCRINLIQRLLFNCTSRIA